MQNTVKRLLIASFLILATFICTDAKCKKDRNDHFKRDYALVDTSGFSQVFNNVAAGGNTDELHSLMVIKDGKVVYEKWDIGHEPLEQHIIWSATKTFMATAIGFAVQEGKLNVQDKVVSFFSKEELPETISENLANLTLWNLLTMSGGFEKDNISSVRSLKWAEPTKEILKFKFKFKPGEKFSYNSSGSYLAGVILSKVTGQTLEEYLRPRLFEPLGIRDFTWEKSAEGLSTGGWGLHLSTESLGRMGQFMLQKGKWNGKQLLNEEWFDEATSAQILQWKGTGISKEEAEVKYKNDEWKQGYGYQVWLCTHNAYRLDGAKGQFCIVIPDKNAVVVTTSNTQHTGTLLTSIWKIIYPKL